MKKDIKELWVNALESGEYAQAQGVLKNENGYCCLGVLCDLYLKSGIDPSAHWASDEESELFLIGNNGSPWSLLPEVQSWAGLESNESPSSPKVKGTLLESLNDQGESFEAIAELIKEYL
jgi:hypothetical protein